MCANLCMHMYEGMGVCLYMDVYKFQGTKFQRRTHDLLLRGDSLVISQLHALNLPSGDLAWVDLAFVPVGAGG